MKRAGGPKVAGRAATGRKPLLRTATSVGNLAVMRWTAAAPAVLVSSTVKDLVVGSGLMFEDAWEHELRGVPDRWHLYTVANERVAKG